MIKNIIFAATLALSACSKLCSMNMEAEESPELFNIQTNDYKLRFRHIDLHNLSNYDAKTLMEQFGDFDALETMFGTLVAVPFKILHWCSPEKVLEIYTKAYDKKFNSMPTDQKIMYQWLIENELNNELVGKLSITTYIDERPQEYKERLMLEIGLFGATKYRNKKIATKMSMLAVQKLATWAPFNDGIFCFSTRADNDAVHKLAKTVGAELIFSHDREVDFELFKLDEPCHLFIIPKENL